MNDFHIFYVKLKLAQETINWQGKFVEWAMRHVHFFRKKIRQIEAAKQKSKQNELFAPILLFKSFAKGFNEFYVDKDRVE